MDVINKIFYIEVEPKFMIQDINNIILTKIKDKYTKTCSEKNGYILEIIKLNKKLICFYSIINILQYLNYNQE